jgi:predicted CXXCH cytochrome family protein
MKAVLLLLGLTSMLVAQDADTIVLKNDSTKYSILSQIENPAEVSSFLAILHTQDPTSRNQLAAAFVKTYPQSWLLPQAYDALARSAIDLGNYDQALSDGRFSLRLLRENPSLLILVANVEAQKGDLKAASADASDALEYLDQIQRPPNLTQTDWNALRPQLKASAYFARARAATLQNAFEAALADLNSAAAWNPTDGEIFYLRAIVQLKLNQKSSAAADLAFVCQNLPALRDKAEKILQILSPKTAINTFPAPHIDATLRNEKPLQYTPQALTQGYAGPDACKNCHAEQYAAWRKTGMARMLQPYDGANIIGDFSPSEYKEGASVIRLGFDRRPYFDFSGQRFYVDFTIGSKWQQGYATRLPDGRLQVLPIEYNALQKQWINYWKLIDPPGSPRAVIQDFPKLTPATSYQQNCAICHTSQLKADLSSAASLEHAQYQLPGVDCEMCHGPSAFHVKTPAQLPLDFRNISNREGVRVCAQCHRQSNVREFGPAGEMNYATKGNFVPATWFMPFDAFSRKAFYKDGRFKETTFIAESFTRSACYLRGTAQCATCHSPHLANFEKNQTSLKFQGTPNEMCLGCHSEYRARIAEHTHHAAGSEASQCVTCHMPRIMNALLFKARSHQIEVPNADLTERFGQQDSPNVCLTCHAEKNALWAKEQLSAWPR